MYKNSSIVSKSYFCQYIPVNIDKIMNTSQGHSASCAVNTCMPVVRCPSWCATFYKQCTKLWVTVQLDWLVMNGNVFEQTPVAGDVRNSGGVRRKTPPRVFNTPPRSRPSPSRVTPPRTSPPRASPLRQLHSRLTRKMVRIPLLSFMLIVFLVQ